MKKFRLTFDAMVIGMLGERRVSAIRSAHSRGEAIVTLVTDYSDIRNMTVEEL